jgi:hypothetical protein
MSRSLYAVLQVAPEADPAVIEAAYKALMKKYHPDVRTDEPTRSRQLAAEINEAFHILKDPGKRAEYDKSERARREAIRRSSAALVDASRPFPQTNPARRRRSKWPALLVIALAGLAVFLIWRGSDGARGGVLGLPSVLTARAKDGGKLAPVAMADVHRAVDEFNSVKERRGLLGLVAFSRDCFAAQSRSEKAADFDFCVAFDQAALTYGSDLPGRDYLPQPPRFELYELDRRHLAAGKLLVNDEKAIRARVAVLGMLTAQRLVELQPPSPPEAEEAAAAVGPAAHARNRRHTARRQKQPPGSSLSHRNAGSRAQADADFLEREGYIY